MKTAREIAADLVWRHGGTFNTTQLESALIEYGNAKLEDAITEVALAKRFDEIIPAIRALKSKEKA